MIYRIDVRTLSAPARGGKAAADPVGEAVRHQIAEFGTTVGSISTSRIFLIDADSGEREVRDAARQLLADPIAERADVVVAGASNGGGKSLIEVHLKPGVMDPVAASTESALRDLGVAVNEVRTGRAYEIEGQVPRAELEQIAGRVLANGVIESIHFEPWVPAEFSRGRDYAFEVRHVPLIRLDDEQLRKLSREGHLFLSLAEMKAAQAYFRELGREPTDAELETLAQTWSEHCVHKTLKSAVDVEVRDEAGAVIGSRRYGNLIKETIFGSTMELMRASDEATKARSDAGAEDPMVSPPSLRRSVASSLPPDPFCLSVFKDNAGVVAFDDVDAVCFKVETHNRPSAIDPYGGSATGIGGVIRDILGTGLGAKPVANTDVFCVADPNYGRDNALLPIRNPQSAIRDLPRGVLHPKRILQQVVAGVRDYGNRMGIPTVNGAVYFDNRYVGNPLVFCGCVGLIPRDKIAKAARPGDAIVVMGGRTGRDGIHGATFSSAELTTTHADEFSHAVQIGNAITEKKTADVILRARDRGLYTAITDCGAGGLSSACGEMAEKIGAHVELEKVPLKYAGLRYDEIWISEAQERMVMSVPPEKLDELLDLAAGENVEATAIGRFGFPSDEGTPHLRLTYNGTEVALMSMDFVHNGIPMPTRKAVVVERHPDAPKPRESAGPHGGMFDKERAARVTEDAKHHLLQTLAHPNVASKHWVIRQYDHEVQGGSVIKPLVGPRQQGPSDASVVRPKLSSHRGVALGCGLAPHVADAYDMALAAIDEAVRNVVAVGADPDRVAILDNFCWPGTDDERSMGALVRACEACRDAALAYRIPFISGKDSLHNQFTNSETGEVIRIPNTLLISAIAVLDDVRRCVTMDLKRPGNTFVHVRPAAEDLAGLSAYHRAVSKVIRSGKVESCHDVSDGGWLAAAAEMCIASGLGLIMEPALRDFFDEPRGQYLMEFNGEAHELAAHVGATAIVERLGAVQDSPELVVHLEDSGFNVGVEELTQAWRGTLDW
jgi:phosphoribosylformylglycinamidine synthase II